MLVIMVTDDLEHIVFKETLTNDCKTVHVTRVFHVKFSISIQSKIFFIVIPDLHVGSFEFQTDSVNGLS